MTTPPVGVIFVHGISNGRSVREGMRARFLAHLTDFKVPVDSQFVDAAIWRSSGRFDYDLDILYRVDGLRNDAIDDVSTAIMNLHDRLPLNGRLLVVGHSMGQVLAYCALDTLSDFGKLFKPYSFMSLGGPLGNTNPVYRSYLAFANRRGPLSKAHEWVDVWNADDPICANIVAPERLLDLMPRTPKSVITNIIQHMGVAVSSMDQRGIGLMYKGYENMKSNELVYPGAFVPSDPMREHSSYFKSSECFDLLKSVHAGLVSL